MRDRLRDYGADVQHSGSAFNLRDLRVIADCGCSEGGNWLRYLVIRAYPQTARKKVAQTRLAGQRAGELFIRRRHPDG